MGNVFPQVDSSKYVTVQNKHALLVDRLYQQMGLVASAVAFSWSKWNSEVDENSVVMLAAEALTDEPLLEEDWSLFMATKRRFMKLKMTEFDETFSEEMAQDIEFKPTLSHYPRKLMSEAAQERATEASIYF